MRPSASVASRTVDEVLPLDAIAHAARAVNGGEGEGRIPPARSPRHPGERVPGAGRNLLPERPFDERHEHRPAWPGDVGAEHLPACDAQDAGAVERDGQRETGPGPGAQERDDPLGARWQPERLVGVGLQDRAQRVDAAHDGREGLPEVLANGGLRSSFELRLGSGRRAEDDVAAREHGLHLGESRRLEGRLEPRHAGVHWAHAPQEGCVRLRAPRFGAG
jgi:hypothetical protein